MVKSLISSSHHYYLTFCEISQFRSLTKVQDIFPINPKSVSLNNAKIASESFYHLQEEIAGLYGSEVVLSANKSKERKGALHYWYDFYIGYADPDRRIVFICYPYTKLSRFLESNFRRLSLKPVFYKASVLKVLDHMRNKGKRNLSRAERDGFEIDITKYTAEVKEEANANKVSLIGANPLNSRIFDVLNEDKSISIEATALKLKCFKAGIGEMELSFDRLGNFRFWLKRDAQMSTLPMIKSIFQFFTEISCLEKGQFLSSYSLLEDE